MLKFTELSIESQSRKNPMERDGRTASNTPVASTSYGKKRFKDLEVLKTSEGTNTAMNVLQK